MLKTTLKRLALPTLASFMCASPFAATSAHAFYQPQSIEDEIFYFVLPDRFNNGNTKNDQGGIDGDKLDHGFDPADQRYYHGGDLKGLMQKLPYIKTLGTTSLWIAPVFKNKPVKADENNQVTFTVAPLSFVIYKSVKSLPTADETLSVAFENLADVVNGTVQLKASVSSDVVSPYALYDVTFEAKVGEGEFAPLGTDRTADYQLYWNTAYIAYGTEVTVRATATNAAGSTASTEQTITVDVVEGMKIFFKKPENWDEARLYFYDAEVAAPAWPGVEMRDLGDDMFMYQFPEGITYATLIFNNNNNGLQSDSFARSSDGCFNEVDGWTESCDLPFYVYFEKPEFWGTDINVHYWNAGLADNTIWPGFAMEHIAENWYSYKFPAGVEAADIIFNDNAGNQSPNLYRELSGCYSADAWTDTCVLPEVGEPVDLGPYNTTIYVRGSMNGWGAVDAFTYEGEGIYAVELELATGEHMFKIADSAWSAGTNFGGHFSTADGVLEFGVAENLQDQSSTNLTYTVAEAGTYRFVLDTNTALITEPTLTVTNPVVPNPYGDTELFIKGDFNGWGNVDAFTYNNDGTFTATLALNPGTYGFKVADAAWSAGTNFGVVFGAESAALVIDGEATVLQDQSSTNASITVATAGEYTFTLTVGDVVSEPELAVTSN